MRATIGNATLYLGDCLEVMRTLPKASVQCCVTSPPYYGLRDYGHADQIGLANILNRIRAYSDAVGAQYWTPSALLVELAEKNTGFYAKA